MKRFKDLKIGQRLMISLSLILVMVFAASNIVSMVQNKNKILVDTNTRMQEQVIDLAEMIDLEVIAGSDKVQITRNVAKALLLEYQSRMNQENDESLFDFLAAGDSYVDEASAITEGASVSVFELRSNGLVRITTSVINDGKRSVGTVISLSSEVAKTILAQKEFSGRSIVIDTWFLTSYFPIMEDGEVVGAVGVGVVEKDMEGLREIFLSKQYYDSGYPFLVDSDGIMAIHPKSEGISIAENDFFIQMKNSNEETGEIHYVWEGEDKILYFKYSEAIDSYVAVSIYEEELMGVIKNERRRMIASLVIIIVVIMLVVRVVVNNVTKGITKSVAFAEDVANGNLTKTLDIDQKDEIGQLSNALNSMIMKLREIVSGIINSANNIASASQQLSSSSQEMSQGANEQASSIEEVSSTMEEVSSNIEQNTMNANQTEKVSSEANTSIKKVAEKSQQAVDANKKISEKITIINDIAFQTNILALNAAVEAARAGEHGKGFAVVAAEVRKLAERSKLAADEIVELADTGLKFTQESGAVMEETIPKIDNTTKLIQEISAASNEQNNGAAQVNNAIQQLNQITQQNASASEELATSAEEMASQAEQLKDLTTFFQINLDEKKGYGDDSIDYSSNPALEE